MKLLGWDTSSKTGAFVALEWEAEANRWGSVRLVTEMSMNVDSTHSERLLWGIHQVLESARWKLEDVDFFGVGLGPGSFTGLRIGLTTARTLSHTLKKPLVGVSSLAALARPVALQFASEEKSPIYVIASTDACKGELFALWGEAKAVSRSSVVPDEREKGLWKKGVHEEVIEPSDLVTQITRLVSQKKNARWIMVGEGRKRLEEKYSDDWKRLNQDQRIESDGFLFSNEVQGRYLGQLFWEAMQEGIFQEGLNVFPRYLRASDAELKLKKKLMLLSES